MNATTWVICLIGAADGRFSSAYVMGWLMAACRLQDPEATPAGNDDKRRRVMESIRGRRRRVLAASSPHDPGFRVTLR
jgi:hypothetical protein